VGHLRILKGVSGEVCDDAITRGLTSGRRDRGFWK